ncbi:hypothetical protein AGI3411_05139 [Achromobacter agilis]|uniref:Uncharacterized protein n=1 Tax=Achromobacter agilis TaxID=1353888 RepID=A0A446CUC6_9BURK|nr:hypothetical protein AGI3411_05139 [Achromobacter agilis]
MKTGRLERPVCFCRQRLAAQPSADTAGAAAWYWSVTCVHPTAAIAASVNKIALQSRCVMRAPLPFFVIEPPSGFRHNYTLQIPLPALRKSGQDIAGM